VAEWQVKTICSFIGAQAMVDTEKHGGRNPLVELAASLDIFATRSPEERELDRIRGPKVADRLEDDARFARVAADPAAGVEASNAAGSYEGFAAMFGAAAPPPVPEDIALSGGGG
jgi:hypothetical protein